MIELQNVTKLYGPVIGVNDVTITLAPGAYGLLGPNGSGKTTLLNLITGQLRPTLGRATVFGVSPFRRTRVLRRIGLCPAVDVLYANVSALEWVKYLLELHGFNRREADWRARQALELVGLTDDCQRAMGGYSLGMRQRAKLAQSLAHDPELLILDEPFNGLDPVARHDMTTLLVDWIHRGRSLILASHLLHEVEAISESFLLMYGGRLLASGSAPEVRRLLAGMPNEIHIRCDHAGELARLLIQHDTVQSVRFDEDQNVLIVASRNPLAVYQQLPGWLAGTTIKIHELRPTDESLGALFHALTRRHRGEDT